MCFLSLTTQRLSSVERATPKVPRKTFVGYLSNIALIRARYPYYNTLRSEIIGLRERPVMEATNSFLAGEARDFDSFSECLDWCRANKESIGSETDRPTYIFFCHTLCPYAERVWLALLEEEQARDQFVMVHVDLSNKPRWYLDHIHPRGLVPALLIDYGTSDSLDIRIESMDICMWILGSKQGVSADITAVVSTALDAIAGNSRYWGIGTKISKRQQTDFEDACKKVFYPSRSLSRLESITLFPFMYRALVAMQLSYGIDIRHMCDGQVGQWMDSMLERESTMITCAERHLLEKAFERHKSLDFFDYDPYGMFDLHPHLTKP